MWTRWESDTARPCQGSRARAAPPRWERPPARSAQRCESGGKARRASGGCPSFIPKRAHTRLVVGPTRAHLDPQLQEDLGVQQLFQLAGLALFAGIANSFETPTRQAFFVQLLDDRDDLPNAIALNSSVFNLTRIVRSWARR